MDWEIIGVIVEGVGALAVIVTLIFLVREIRHNTRTLVRAEARETQRDCTAAYYAVAGDEQTSEIVLRGMGGMDALTEVERYRYDLIVGGWLLPVEQAFLAAEENRYDETNLRPFEAQIRGIMVSAGGSVWWKARKFWFTPVFQRIVEGLIRDTTIATRATMSNRDLK
jgi:hypothetical protein